mgnify:CR=1 FL=1
MIRITILLVLLAQTTVAQKLKKKDKVVFTNLQKHVSFLADDKLEGRRTGTNGEKLAYEYISSEFSKAGLIAKGDNNTYLQAFEVNEGKEVNKQKTDIAKNIFNTELKRHSLSPNLRQMASTRIVCANEIESNFFVGSYFILNVLY